MPTSSSTRVSSGVSPGKTSLPETVRREIARLLWMSAALVLFLSLASYSPSDPSWSTWSSRGEFHNLMGRFGSILADLFFQFLGLGCFGIIGLLATKPFKNSADEKGAL